MREGECEKGVLKRRRERWQWMGLGGGGVFGKKGEEKRRKEKGR